MLLLSKHFHFEGARMRKTALFLGVTLCSGASLAEPRPFDECTVAARPSLACQSFFERIKPAREKLRDASPWVDVVPASVCITLEKTRRIDEDEYDDCIRVFEEDIKDYPPVFFIDSEPE
jgi:hypothetical protein